MGVCQHPCSISSAKISLKAYKDNSKMKDHKSAHEYPEGRQLLFENSYRAILFNVSLGALLATYLVNNKVPKELAIVWFIAMAVVSMIRIIHCKSVINNKLFTELDDFHLKIFLFLTLLTGITWTSIYFITFSYTSELQQYLILLVFGGMCAGATTSLAVYLQSFYAFIMSMFLPVIFYNLYYWEFNNFIVASIFIFFLLGVSIIATSNQTVLKKLFFLTAQNKTLIDKLETLSITDSLTGLYNRRHFTKVLQDEQNRAKRNQQSFVLISIDIDNFKVINDNLGHPVGDKFLVYVADYLKNYLQRINDIIFRLGGDEFAIIILNTTKESAIALCHQIQTHFKIYPRFDCHPHNRNIKNILDQVTMSIGVVYVPHLSSDNIEMIIEKADKMLYLAKNTGKNKIEVSE